jgi:hypothetical protein
MLLQMVNRVEFRAVWRLGYQPYIFRNLEFFGHMPSGAINEHDHEEVFEVFGDSTNGPHMAPIDKKSDPRITVTP